ncbi:hypothetical protein [Synechococcus sp. UW179A]|uniref:hypothetical protein n=1 Tax=Synechococcus sp. UW179A TaxID=2575510 RepID=UPI001A7E18E4|nr:hypothetical protein [Synechococcus sp. UW179A]
MAIAPMRVESKFIEIGGADDSRYSTSADRRSRLTSGSCSNSLNNDLGWSFG